MRQLHNLFALGPSLLLWCLQMPLAHANINSPNPYSPETFPHAHIPQYEHRDQRHKSILSRWRDGLIKKIWSVPQMDCHMKGPKPPSRTTPPSVVLSRYGGDVVLRFKIRTADEAAALADAVDVLFLDVWGFTTEWADIRLSKDVVPSLLGLLPSSLRDAHTPLMHDLAQAIYESYPSLTFQDPSAQTHDDHRSFSPSLRPSTQTNIFFQNYQPLSVITPWMRLLQSLFPSHVRMLNIGLSYEGRDIPALRVGVHPTNSEKPSEKRKTIIVAGGSHAREWVSTSTVNYIAYTFITEYGKNKDVTNLLEQFDWIFIPTMNPDGYTYTWESDRLWRKNRQQTSLRFCKGLDLDRAWGFEWDRQASNTNPCSENFGGEEPFQAVESRRLANWAKNETENNNVTFSAFVDLHSYSQQVLYPFSYSCTETPPTLENLQECAIGMAKAIRLTKGSIYGVTSACEGSVIAESASDPLYPKDKSAWPQLESSGGSALDWFYHELRAAYSYQIKLRDTGSYGFLLPASEIVPTGKEGLAAVQYLGSFLLGDKGIEKGLGDGHGRWREEGMERVVGLRGEMEDEEIELEDGEEEVTDDYEGVQWELKR